jgi:tyrosinase
LGLVFGQEPFNPSSTKPFESNIFDPITGFEGNGNFIAPTADQNPLNITGSTGGGCVKDGPIAPPSFVVNFSTPDCMRRDFVPWILYSFADPTLVRNVLAHEDYTSFARAIENIPSFGEPNLHGSGRFGVGGGLGTIGNAANSPEGKFSFHL